MTQKAVEWVLQRLEPVVQAGPVAGCLDREIEQAVDLDPYELKALRQTRWEVVHTYLADAEARRLADQFGADVVAPSR